MNAENKVVTLVWSHMSIYIGHINQLNWHKLAVPAFIIGLEQDISIFYSRHQKPIRVRSALLPAGYLHATDYGKGLMAAVLLDPLSDQFAEIKEGMDVSLQGLYVDFRHQDKMISELRSFYDCLPDLDSAQQCFNALLTDKLGAPSVLLNEARAFKQLDPRIQRVIDQIRAVPRGRSSVDSLAENAALSKVHLERLFKQQVGVSIGKYQQWLKLSEAVCLVVKGRSFSQSAEVMGFNDLAHYSKLFKTVVGTSPTSLLPQKQLRGKAYSECTSVNET